jgi:hypothetical protein
MRIYLDDIRNPPLFDRYTGERLDWVICRTAAEVIVLLDSHKVKYISFDHDLGPDPAGTGYDVAKFIESQAHTNPDFPPVDYDIHSGNPVGSNNIDQDMKSAWRVWDNPANSPKKE